MIQAASLMLLFSHIITPTITTAPLGLLLWEQHNSSSFLLSISFLIMLDARSIFNLCQCWVYSRGTSSWIPTALLGCLIPKHGRRVARQGSITTHSSQFVIKRFNPLPHNIKHASKQATHNSAAHQPCSFKLHLSTCTSRHTHCS